MKLDLRLVDFGGLGGNPTIVAIKINPEIDTKLNHRTAPPFETSAGSLVPGTLVRHIPILANERASHRFRNIYVDPTVLCNIHARIASECQCVSPEKR